MINSEENIRELDSLAVRRTVMRCQVRSTKRANIQGKKDMASSRLHDTGRQVVRKGTIESC